MLMPITVTERVCAWAREAKRAAHRGHGDAADGHPVPPHHRRSAPPSAVTAHVLGPQFLAGDGLHRSRPADGGPLDVWLVEPPTVQRRRSPRAPAGVVVDADRGSCLHAPSVGTEEWRAATPDVLLLHRRRRCAAASSIALGGVRGHRTVSCTTPAKPAAKREGVAVSRCACEVSGVRVRHHALGAAV
jgi:hypothetical protein